MLLGSFWGASYLFMRIAVPTYGPLPLAASRVIIGTLLLAGYAWLRGRRVRFAGHWRQLLILGFANLALPFALIATAELRISASMGTILNATAPFFGVLAGRLFFGAPLRPRQVVGAVVGFTGVAVLVGGAELVTDPLALLSTALMLVAALSYTLGAHYARRVFATMSAFEVSLGHLVCAALLLTGPALLTLPAEAPPVEATLAVLGLGTLSTAGAYLIYFGLIERAGAIAAVSVTFLIPVFGVLLAVLFLQEPLHGGLLLGGAVILLGVALVSGILDRPGPAAPPG